MFISTYLVENNILLFLPFVNQIKSIIYIGIYIYFTQVNLLNVR